MHRLRMRMSVLCIGTIVSSFILVAQNLETVRLAEESKLIEPEVPFIEQIPVIDGALDIPLRSLPVRHFTVVYKAATDSLVPVSYRLG